MADFKFNASEVICNGVGGNGYSAVYKLKDQIKELVVGVREDLGTEIIYNTIIEQNPHEDFYVGSRFNDIDSVVSRLVTGLGNWAWKDFESDELVEMRVLNILETISKEDATTIVIDAHRCCASADHWYTFEKDWG